MCLGGGGGGAGICRAGRMVSGASLCNRMLIFVLSYSGAELCGARAME